MSPMELAHLMKGNIDPALLTVGAIDRVVCLSIKVRSIPGQIHTEEYGRCYTTVSALSAAAVAAHQHVHQRQQPWQSNPPPASERDLMLDIEVGPTQTSI